jgi:hypothetical protein
MKLSHIAAAAGLFIAALGVGGTAEARPHDGPRYSDGYRDHRGGGDHRWDRGRGHYRDVYRGDRGRGRAYAYGRGRPRCWTEYRRHRAVRVCR